MKNLNLEFDTNNVIHTEFGVGQDQDEDNEEVFVVVPVDEEVQNALQEMVEATWKKMQKAAENSTSEEYEPSQ